MRSQRRAGEARPSRGRRQARAPLGLFDQEHEFEAQPAAQRLGLIGLIAAPQRARALVAVRDGDVLGRVTLQLVLSTAMGGPAAVLEDLVVDASPQCEGVGSILLAAAIEQAASLDCRRPSLLTHAENAKAQRLYERHGFERSTMSRCGS